MNSTTGSLIRRQAGVHPALVDLAFVLVFMFLILSTLADTTEKRTESELALPPLDLPELDLPEGGMSGAGEAQESVSLLADGAILLGGDSVATLEALSLRLIDLGNPAVLLRVEEDVPYGRVAELLGLCNQLGIEEVSLTYEAVSN